MSEIILTEQLAVRFARIALGHVVLHEPRVVITNYIAEDLPKEIKRLDTALANLRADLDRMLERGDVAEGGEHQTGSAHV